MAEIDKARSEPRNSGRKLAASSLLQKIEPISGVSMERQVYQSLKFSIMTGQVLPGSRMTSRTLSNALGVSATPVREALKRLESDGALVSKNKSAFIINELDYYDFLEILEARLLLEGEAVRKATQRATELNIQPIRKINENYKNLIKDPYHNVSKSLAVNFRFHFELYMLAGSKTLIKFIESLWLRVGPALNLYMSDEVRRQSAMPHDNVLEAVARRDPDDAEKWIRHDLTLAADFILAQLKKEY